MAENSAKVRKIEEELANLQEARVASAEHAKVTQAAISAALNAAAERIESLTRRLNQTIGDNGVGTATAKSMVLNLVLVTLIGMFGTQVFWGANPRAPIGG